MENSGRNVFILTTSYLFLEKPFSGFSVKIVFTQQKSNSWGNLNRSWRDFLGISKKLMFY